MDKNDLLSAFQTYLEGAEWAETQEEDADLYGLLTEMAALRTEVKAESRQFKNALDDFKQVLEHQQSNYDSLAKNLDSAKTEQQRQVQAAQRDLLLDWLEVYDRMAAGLEVLLHYKAGFWSGKRHKALVESVREGQSMTLRRMTQLLERYHVHPIETVGKVLDPYLMRAVETVNDTRYENACVVEELRTGFIWHQEVLRLAEVKVNKLTEDSHE